MNSHAVRRAVLAGAFLVGSAIVPSRIYACGLELQVNPAAIPRDTVSSATATATISPARAGVQVSFSINYGPGTVNPTSATTDALGQATTTVKASSIAEGEAGTATVSVRASANGEIADAGLTVRGLNMTLVTQYPRIYIGNASWRKDTRLTCTVKDTAGIAAQGNVTFQTQDGSLTGANPAALDAHGVAYIYLNPGNAAFVNTASAVLGPITKSVQVTFADHTTMSLEINPHKKTNETARAKAKLRDQDDQPFPGAQVNFYWQIPNNQEDTDSLTTPTGDPPPDLWVSSEGPLPTNDGWGSVQVTTARIANPQCPVKITAPFNWTVSILEGEGLTIKTGWEGNGIKFSVTTDPDLKFAVSASKSW